MAGPYEGGMIGADIPGGLAVPPEYQAAPKLQQRLDLERSLVYATKDDGLAASAPDGDRG